MNVRKTLILALLLGTTLPALFAHADEYSWQMKQLFNPSEARLHSESQGKIIIYQGLKDIS